VFEMSLLNFPASHKAQLSAVVHTLIECENTPGSRKRLPGAHAHWLMSSTPGGTNKVDPEHDRHCPAWVAPAPTVNVAMGHGVHAALPSMLL